jgi:mRNA-degrading endonuclease RelE of RelBE toxin-antitoxin system
VAREAAVALRPQAERDLRRLGRDDRKRLGDALRLLAAGAENLDVKPLSGAAPRRRLRVGDYRVLYREATNDIFVVARVVNRRDLILAVKNIDRRPG